MRNTEAERDRGEYRQIAGVTDFVAECSNSPSSLSMDEKVKQRPEDKRDVPAPDEALDQAEQESRPSEQLETWKKDSKCRVIDR